MAKIQMQTKPKATVENVFYSFIAAAATRGVKEKTLLTYKQHSSLTLSIACFIREV